MILPLFGYTIYNPSILLKNQSSFLNNLFRNRLQLIFLTDSPIWVFICRQAHTHTCTHWVSFYLSFLSSPKSPSQELEQKKKKEEEAKAKEKEIELKAAEEKEASNPELLEVRVRLDKLEETLKEFVVESKKQMNSGQTKEHEGGNEKKDIVTEASSRSSSESSKPVEKDPPSKQDSVEPGPALSKEWVVGQHPVPNAHLQDQEGKTPASEDAKR